jgi:hypothetical protein
LCKALLPILPSVLALLETNVAARPYLSC